MNITFIDEMITLFLLMFLLVVLLATMDNLEKLVQTQATT